MFSALMLVRMREAVYNTPGDLTERESWLSDDSVDALDLPLAKAAEKVLGSMHEVLTKTAEGMKSRVEKGKRFVEEEGKWRRQQANGTMNGSSDGDGDGHVDKKAKLEPETTTNGNGVSGTAGEENKEKTEEERIKEEEDQRRKQLEEQEKEVAEAKKRLHLMKSKAAELRLVRHLDSLRRPKVEFRARRIECS